MKDDERHLQLLLAFATLELQKVLTSLEHADEMLSYANKIGNFLAAMHIQNFKQTKIDTYLPST